MFNRCSALATLDMYYHDYDFCYFYYFLGRASKAIGVLNIIQIRKIKRIVKANNIGTRMYMKFKMKKRKL